jgi:hypothetical protein
MKITRLPKLITGERPVAVAPTFAPAIDAAWQRRLNLYAGRTLTAGALDAEQTHRGARLALSGQAISPGVVYGLECAIESETTLSTERRKPLNSCGSNPAWALPPTAKRSASTRASASQS